jgi:UDP-N-acetylmuramoyl-tripeptide--D-alanyl-D-alanine ligase
MTSLERIYQLFVQNPSITTDSRQVQKGSIFFALKGDTFDGNKFALEAIRQGCVAAIVDDPIIRDEHCIYVDNVLMTLQIISNIHRRSLGVKVLAITGTNGKTTTKELISVVLSQQYRVFATKGNFNNHIGVPLTLLSLTKDVELAIVEMGANHPGEIQHLSSIAEPDYGIITNIGKAHLEGFGSFEGVKQTKGELYHFIAERHGSVFFNPNNTILVDLIENNKLKDHSIPYGYGLEEMEIESSRSSQFLCLRIRLIDNDNFQWIQTKLVGNYNYENVQAAITVGLYMGIKFELIKDAIENYVPSNSRSQLVKTIRNTVILDAYNANPSSMEVAIRNFASIESRNKVLILGEMLELGDHSAMEHKKIADIVKSYAFNLLIFIGKGFKNEADKCLFFDDSESCAKYLADHSIENALVLLKGSRGVKLEKLMERL